MSKGLPDFLVDHGSCPSLLPHFSTLLVATVILLDQDSCPSTLLELLLLVIAAELALDQDGGQRHLFVKCILRGHKGQYPCQKQKKIKMFASWKEAVVVEGRVPS